MVHPKSRIISGKKYTFQYAYSMKIDAQREAKRLRDSGYYARVISKVKTERTHKRYAVYYR